MISMLKNNIILKAFSLFLAILLWFYVSHQENPVTEQVFTVPLEVSGVAESLVVSDNPSFVKVRIQGQRLTLETMSSRDIQASIELSGLDVGQHLVDVSVALPKKTQLVSVIPDTVTINLEIVTTKQIPVNITYATGTPAEGYQALTPVIQPNQVIISGPQDKLKEVKQAYIEVNLADYKTNYHQTLPVKILDQNGDLVLDWVTVQPENVDVLIPIVEEMPSKTVPVKVPLTGEPAEGYSLSRVVVEPSLVAIYGEADIIDQIDWVTTNKLDISGAKENVVQTMTIDLPEQVTMEQKADVTAIVQIEKIVQKSLNSIEIIARQTAQGLTPQMKPMITEIVIEGPQSIVEKIAADDIAVYVDLTSLEAGDYRLQVKTELPAGVTLISQKDQEINVKLQ